MDRGDWWAIVPRFKKSWIRMKQLSTHAGPILGGGLVAVMSDSCDPIDCSLPGFSIYGILQARILEWVAISFSRGSSRPRDRTRVSCIAVRDALPSELQEDLFNII